MNESHISGESDDGGAFSVLDFVISEQVQFKTFIYRFVESFTGYPNI